jgi:hypothetical protein
MVMPGEAGPLIVSILSVTFGSVLASVIVPLMLKFIVSLPVPAAQPFIAVIVFAAVIASRNTQMPGAPVSASELTVIAAAPADVLNASAKVTTIGATSATRILSVALIPATARVCRPIMDASPAERFAVSPTMVMPPLMRLKGTGMRLLTI